MTRDNAEIVRRGFEAWDAGDDDALPTYFSPDVEIDASDRILNPAVYRGLDGARRFRSEISETWGGFSVEIEELLVSGDRVVAFVRVSGQGRASGAAVDSRSAWLRQFRSARSSFHKPPWALPETAFCTTSAHVPNGQVVRNLPARAM